MKIIYLDQFFVRKCFCPDSNEEHASFFEDAVARCLDLARRGIVSFPFSESHLRETSSVTDLKQREILVNSFQELSNGYRFPSFSVVLCTQAVALRKGLQTNWAASDILEDKKNFANELQSIAAYRRDDHAQHLRQVYARWSNLPDSEADLISRREANTYLRIIVEDLPTIFQGSDEATMTRLNSPHIHLINELFWAAVEDGTEDPEEDALVFLRDHAAEIPCVRLSSVLWGYFGKVKKKTLPNLKKPAAPAEDNLFISHFLPYCDAAFVDKAMRAYIEERKLFQSFKTEVFSLQNKDKFMRYLSDLG